MQFSKNNTKLKKTIKLIKELNIGLPHHYLVWGLPAFETETGITICPGAGACSGPCFARSGHYTFKRRKEIELDNYYATLDKHFVTNIRCMLEAYPATIVRIHDSGDFYSEEYFMHWILLADLLPQHVFYAYTKSWHETAYWRYLNREYRLPHNFQLVYSYGGKHDAKLATYNEKELARGRRPLPTSKIFLTEEHAIADNYTPCPTDLEAIHGEDNIGLIYHNNKHHRNFKWTEGGSLYSKSQSESHIE
jgi:hypothetical protein